jgi:hypothetical protein
VGFFFTKICTVDVDRFQGPLLACSRRSSLVSMDAFLVSVVFFHTFGVGISCVVRCNKLIFFLFIMEKVLITLV